MQEGGPNELDLKSFKKTSSMEIPVTYSSKRSENIPYDSRPINPHGSKHFFGIKNTHLIIFGIILIIGLISYLLLLSVESQSFYIGNWKASDTETLQKSNIKSLSFEISDTQILQKLTTDSNSIQTDSIISYQIKINSQTQTKAILRITDIKLQEVNVIIPEQICEKFNNCDSAKKEIESQFNNTFQKNLPKELSGNFIITKTNDSAKIKVPSGTEYILDKE